MTKGRLIAGGVTAAAVLALGAGYVVSTGNTALPVTTATATVETITVTTNAKGTMVPNRTTSVFGTVAGTLGSVRVSDGATVKKGHELARIATGPLDVAVTQAESALATAEAMPKSTRRLRWARTQAIDAAWAQLRQARADRAAATIKAPAAGVVDVPDTTAKGAAVTPGGLLFTISDPTKLRFEADVDEADIAAIHKGLKGAILLDSFAGYDFPGTVISVGRSAVKTDTGGNAFTVRLSVDSVEPGERVLLEGMSGSVYIDVKEIPDAIAVPNAAVLTEGDHSYVFVVGSDSTVWKKSVQLGAVTDTWVEVMVGLNAGDVVVTSQLSALRDGMKILDQ